MERGEQVGEQEEGGGDSIGKRKTSRANEMDGECA